MDFITQNRDVIYLALLIVLLLVERWVGKTDKIPESSIMDFLEKRVLEKIKGNGNG
jgi:hypothetical protein